MITNMWEVGWGKGRELRIWCVFTRGQSAAMELPEQDNDLDPYREYVDTLGLMYNES